ncbi:MAG: hypothetical protein HY012_02190 [Acidobacteria bacterium]|nr:hypothetical protein [Acidobacteriota bacterium]
MAKKSNAATAFSKYLSHVLNAQKLKAWKWKHNYPAAGTRETVDVAGFKRGKIKVLIEIERLREDPSSNVVKVWGWVADRKLPNRILFIQVFSGAFAAAKAPRKRRALFLAGKMKEDSSSIRYKHVNFSLVPRSGAKSIGGASKRVIHGIAKKVWALTLER